MIYLYSGPVINLSKQILPFYKISYKIAKTSIKKLHNMI